MNDSALKKHHPMVDFITNRSCFFSVDAPNRCTLEAQVRLKGLEMVIQFDRVIELPQEMRRAKITSLFAESKK